MSSATRLRRRPGARSGEDQGLDSLLDTMTNVVGILIVVMAVTQLTISGAIERIRAIGDGSAGGFEEISLPGAGDAAPPTEAELDRLRKELSALADDLVRARTTRELRDASSTAIAAERSNLERQTQALRVDIQRERAALQDLQVRLDSTVAALPVRSVRLPDPRTAPPGARQLAVLCRYGRCFPVDARQLNTTLQRGIEQATGLAPGLARGPAQYRQATDYFDRHDLGDDNLRLRFDTRGIWSLEWRGEKRGETLPQLRSASSRYRRELDAADPSSRYLTFFVWPDAFESYLGARELGEARGFAAGWVVMARKQELEQRFHNPGQDPTPID